MTALLVFLVFALSWLFFCAYVAVHAVRLYQMPNTIAESISSRFFLGGIAAGVALSLVTVFLP